jgi:hypothetical protein
MGGFTKEGDGQMNIDDLEEVSQYNELGWVSILAKAILLNKVSIKNGNIMVEEFTEDEI